MKNDIVVTGDSGVGPTDIENMIPGTVISSNGESYKDCISITPLEIIERLKKGEKFKTASPIMGDYIDKFTSILETNKDIIHLSMSSGISEGSVNSSNLAASILHDDYKNKVHVIDSLNGATGGTLLYLYAKYLVNEGLSVEEICSKLNEERKKIDTLFFVPDPSGFIYSGRNKSDLCLKDHAKVLGVNALKLAGTKYCVMFNKEGNLYFKNLVRGSMNAKAIETVTRMINKDNLNEFDNKYFVYTVTNPQKVDKEGIENYIRDLNYFDCIVDKPMNGVFASYACDDLMVLSLKKK